LDAFPATNGRNTLLAAGYYLAGLLGLSLAFLHPSASPVWPPSGIALAALLLYGRRLWPGVLLGALLVNLTAPGSPVAALTIAAGNALEAVSAWLVEAFRPRAVAFQRPQDVFKFAALAGS
jgi:integral membrane sensor domain MASE1